jgi:hypothetical protein
MFVVRQIWMGNGQRSDGFMLSPAAAAVGKLKGLCYSCSSSQERPGEGHFECYLASLDRTFC